MFFFFRKRIVVGKNNIPKQGPAILVANHPVTFLDPLLVAATTKRPVHFLAKGAMFKNRLIRGIFKTFNMIPIYRAQDNLGDMTKNQDTFKYCYEHLEQGGLILIFPEGVSFTDRTLKPIKTGAARIALGAENRNGFKLGVEIIPFGLTYEAPHKFRKDVLVNVGKSISMLDLREKYIHNDRQVVKDLTFQIEQNLKDLTLNCENPVQEAMADFLLLENADNEMSLEVSVKQIKKLLDRLKPGENEHIANQIYLLARKQNAVGVQNLSSGENLSVVKETAVFIFSFVLGIPLMIFGLIHNWLPYYISPVIAQKITKVKEYQGPIAMTTGMVICLITYPLFGWLFFVIVGSWFLTTVYLISLPLIGLVAYGFSMQFQFLLAQWKLVRLFQSKREQISELIILRREVLGSLEMS